MFGKGRLQVTEKNRQPLERQFGLFGAYEREPTFFERVSDAMAKISKKTVDSIDFFYGSSLRVDIAQAASTGILAGLILGLLSSNSMSGVAVGPLASHVASALGCFLTTAIVLHRIWPSDFRRVFPTWLLIPMFGILLSMGLNSAPNAITVWRSWPRPELSFAEYAIGQLSDATVPYLVFNALTIPVAAFIHFFGPVSKRMRL
jgi:hypothetical protein